MEMKRSSLLLTLLVIGVWCESQPAEESYKISSAYFDKLEVFMSSLSGNVYHMELDLYNNDGGILFADGKNLKSTDGKITSIVGTGFTGINGFKQINSTHVAVADYPEHCIKMLNREDQGVQNFAGTCGQRGYVEGKVGTARLYYPWSIEVDVRNPGRLLVTEWYNSALRSVDIETGDLSTVIKTGFNLPTGMAWINDRLLVANYMYVSEVKWPDNQTVTNTRIVGTTSDGYSDGSLNVSKFGYIEDLLRLQDGLYLAADSNNGKLRLIDTFNRNVVPVCIGTQTPCTISSTIHYPRSLLQTKDSIYVGSSRQIYKLSRYVCNYAENVTTYLSPGSNRAEVKLNSYEFGVFPPGVYQLKRKYGSDSCFRYINVLTSPIARTVVFRSVYGVTCATLQNNITKTFLRSVLAHKNNLLMKICTPDCTMSSRIQPWFSCEKDQLTVSWPTDIVYNVDVQKVPDVLSSSLRKRLDSSHLKYGELSILSHNPPVVLPKKNSKGESVLIVLSSSCADDKQTYNAARDVCD